jgi:hypothetical protein
MRVDVTPHRGNRGRVGPDRLDQLHATPRQHGPEGAGILQVGVYQMGEVHARSCSVGHAPWSGDRFSGTASLVRQPDPMRRPADVG